MSLDVSLRTAISGLAVTQKGLDVVSRNVANVQTPGYTRKIHQQAPLDPQVGGARALDPIRIVNEALQRDYIKQNGVVGYLETRESILKRIEVAHGNPEDHNSLASLYGKLQEGFASLAGTPESGPYRQRVVDEARRLAEGMNGLAEVYNKERDRTQEEIAASVRRMNTLTAQIADLNRQISMAVVQGRGVPDLEDQRDELVRNLSEQMDINTVKRADGVVVVLTSNGRTLVERSAQPLTFQMTKTDERSYYDRDGRSGINPILLNGEDVTPELQGGKLGALIELRDKTIPQFQAQLDEFAYRLATAFESAWGTNDNGTPADYTDDIHSGLKLFVDSDPAQPRDVPVKYPAGVAPPLSNPAERQRIGFASRIMINPTVSADPNLVQRGTNMSPAITSPADTRLIDAVRRNVLERADTPFDTAGLGPFGKISTGLPPAGSFADYATEVVAYQAVTRSDTTVGIQGEVRYREALSTRLQDETGVNLDQEITLLIQLQQTYGANARVVTTNQQMFDDLLRAFG
ncbi:MAG TPA: flagellar hook-associated protein FlgK [Azospirillaceae bacterium]|nr:flagellar hook-associated protein FlgK [Azospirillaceae bacterium]